MDTASQRIERRFGKHGELYADIDCFDPRNCHEICEQKLPNLALEKVSALLRQHFPDTEVDCLREELLSFAKHWPKLKQTLAGQFLTLVEVRTAMN